LAQAVPGWRNPINRDNIAAWMPLKYNEDGSLDLYLQKDSPGKRKEANWLPGPVGGFSATMRIYCPKESVLAGADRWAWLFGRVAWMAQCSWNILVSPTMNVASGLNSRPVSLDPLKSTNSIKSNRPSSDLLPGIGCARPHDCGHNTQTAYPPPFADLVPYLIFCNPANAVRQVI
jgi:hypothetical protein